MNTNAIPFPPDGNEDAIRTQTPIVIPALADPAKEWSPSFLSVPLLRVTTDALLLICGTTVGGSLGHMLQLTHSFDLGTQRLLIGSLIYTGIVLCFLQSDNAYPRACSLLHVKE